MSRIQELTVAILAKLSESATPVDEAVLNQLLNSRFSPDVTYIELADALSVLEGSRCVGKINNLRGPRWFITDKGRAELHS
jgi:hypothetical protein